jgi:hypothetical protein
MKDVIKKFKFKEAGVVINAPSSIEKEMKELGFKTLFAENEPSKNTVVFINNKKELTGFLGQQLKNIEPDSVFWFAYPKSTSKTKTDINRDIIRETAEGYGVTAVAAISIDDTWSGLRLRPVDKVGK